ncbi:MAG TPA: hypothetical protein VLS90_02225, partial [Thermodesulfobacteriota bacterium]|nr:hypothetical protein [Thermodesulfobacteriota bacterium]
MEKMIGGALAAALRDGRAGYNGKFARAKLLMPRLDEGEFAVFLRDNIQPVVETLDRAAPERTGPVVDTLFDAALDFTGKGLAGLPGLTEG